MEDPGFTALSARLRRRIDNAFDKAVGNSSTSSNCRSRKKRKLHSVEASAGEDKSPGGFLVEEEDAGGFVLDGPEDRSPSPNPISIPLSRIPAALELLGLFPEDEEVLSVFRNAASGWGAERGRGRGPSNEGEVHRKDWRAVCAVLLTAEDGGGSGDEGPLFPLSDEDGDGEADDSGPESDEYRMSVDGDVSEPEAVSDEEYQDDDDDDVDHTGKSAPRKPRKSRKASARSPLDLDVGLLGAKEKAGCREDFAMFFPDVPDAELEQQKIMIKDVTRVANLLKEKIKAEEIIEMLEAFSTSADKSMNLHDFERMMMATKLI